MSADALADPFAAPRAANGRAPDVFKPGAWVAMRVMVPSTMRWYAAA